VTLFDATALDGFEVVGSFAADTPGSGSVEFLLPDVLDIVLGIQFEFFSGFDLDRLDGVARISNLAVVDLNAPPVDVPEPHALWLLMAGFAAMIFLRSQKRTVEGSGPSLLR